MTLEEALLIADDGAHAFNQSWSPALGILAAEVRRQHAEIEMLRTGDTCARMCEGQAYRIEARQARAEIDRLRAALDDARECVDSWSAYASPYFQAKHDLAGDLARIDAARSKT